MYIQSQMESSHLLICAMINLHDALDPTAPNNKQNNVILSSYTPVVDLLYIMQNGTTTANSGHIGNSTDVSATVEPFFPDPSQKITFK